MNWNQTGMPAALVGRLGQKREIAEFKAVLNDAQNHVMQSVDVESMAQELAESGGREFVSMVKALTMALTNAKQELADANRRYERLTADLARRGISIEDDGQSQQLTASSHVEPSGGAEVEDVKSADDGLAEWEEWDRRFRSLLD